MGEVNEFLDNALGFIQEGADISEEMAAYLDSIGLDRKQFSHHMMILEAALLTHAQADVRYGPQWVNYGAVGLAHDLARKASRPWHSILQKFRFGHIKHEELPGADDALDAINYAVFFLRCYAEGNVYGDS